MPPLQIKQIITGKWSSNCYIVSDESSTAVIIDPGESFSTIMSYVTEAKLCVKAILLTHGHFDHIGAASQLKTAVHAPLFVHRNDAKMLKYVNLYRHAFGGESSIEIPIPDGYLSSEELFSAGSLRAEVIETPGHTPGSICLRVDDYIFTGDTLMRGKIGRTDLPGGNNSSLKNSLRLLSMLPLDTAIYPGHGAPTVLAEELRENIFLREVLIGN